MTAARVVAGSLALLTGCASTDPRPAFEEVQQSVASRTGQDAAWAPTSEEAAALETRVAALLAGELTLERAVQVALLNNPALQATFEEIGVSQADLVEAGLPENPELSGFVRFPSEGQGRNTELSFALNVFDLFVAPARRKIAASELQRTKLRVADEVLGLAADVKAAYFTLQARQQLVERLRRILDLTETAESFAHRLHEAGNIPELELQNQIALFRQSKVDVARAEAEVRADREHLNRLLGLWGAQTAWRATPEMPRVPEVEIPLEGLETRAILQRADLGAARWGVDLVGRALALRRKTRFFPVGIHVGVNTEKDLEGPRLTGPELALQLPIFDTGKASIARLEAEHRMAQRRLEARAVNARSEVREARDRMLAARDLALYHKETLLPQRLHILDLTLRYYNMMFKGAFDLLLARQAEVEAEKAHLESWRDYWIAKATLERALGGTLPPHPLPPVMAGPPAQEK
jgi:cobalt-zinc-cadmium efflux system outer membrane protein